MRHCFESVGFDPIRIDALLSTFRDVTQRKTRSFAEQFSVVIPSDSRSWIRINDATNNGGIQRFTFQIDHHEFRRTNEHDGGI